MQFTGAAILDDLAARGLIQDTTDRDALTTRLAAGPITVYCGFDPTADSLHVGNLIPLLLLRRFQEAGHRPIVLAGGATGMIGDPGGRSTERSLLDDDTLAANLERITPQLRQFLDFDEGDNAATLVDNRSWTVALDAISFLRDVGKHITIGQMMAKESVRSRLDSEHGISYTEFSYMLLQANDYLNLHELDGCELQVGGSDQWGNISLGVDLIRRRTGAHVHGLTVPLLVQPDGSKYGKTASGDQIWLGAHRMSPYRFYQAWIQSEDSEMAKLLNQLTLLSTDEVASVVADHEAAPERRGAQRRLAKELTALVHGDERAAGAEDASDVLFGQGDVRTLDGAALEALADEVPGTVIDRSRLVDGVGAVELLAEIGLATSRGDARRTLEQGGFSANGERLAVDTTLEIDDLVAGRYLLARRGKNRYHLVTTA